MTSPVSGAKSGNRARPPIAVFLLDDHEIVRRGVRDLLEAEPGITVVGEAGTAESAIARIPALRPDVAVLDVRLPDGSGVTVCREIRSTIFQLQARGATGPDLRGEIVALVDDMTDMLGFAPSLRLGGGLGGQVSGEVADQALAALREALSNAGRHACATAVDVTVDVDSSQFLVVQVIDNGTGIPAAGRRSGLRNMARRAERLGGELRLGPANENAPTPGTKLEWRAPAG